MNPDPKIWTWNEHLKTWLMGTENEGCGVFEDHGLWFGNVSAGGNITLHGPDTFENLIENLPKELAKIVASF